MRKMMVCAALLGLALGCSRSSSSSSSASSGGAAEAQQIYTSRCATCHGQEGTGDGPAGTALTPRPRNFHDGAWQASVTDDQIDRVIREGGAAIGKSPLMPPNPDLVARPEVVVALRQRVRAYR
jgi:mono/diheme cytochrome c family protein